MTIILINIPGISDTNPLSNYLGSIWRNGFLLVLVILFQDVFYYNEHQATILYVETDARSDGQNTKSQNRRFFKGSLASVKVFYYAS